MQKTQPSIPCEDEQYIYPHLVDFFNGKRCTMHGYYDMGMKREDLFHAVFLQTSFGIGE